MLTYKAQLQKINKSIDIQDTPESSIGYIIAEFLKTSERCNHIYIAKDEVEMTHIAKTVGFFNEDVVVLKFPQWDCTAYDISSPKREVMAKRMEVLHELVKINSAICHSQPKAGNPEKKYELYTELEGKSQLDPLATLEDDKLGKNDKLKQSNANPSLRAERSVAWQSKNIETGKMDCHGLRPRNDASYTQKILLITTPKSFMQKVPSRHLLQKSCLTLEVGDSFAIENLEKFLEFNGYTKCATANKVGEYAVHGDIVDVVTDHKNSAYRFQFVGDTVNDIKNFDISTQISSGVVKKLSIIPADEVILRDEEIQNFRANYRDVFGAVSKDDTLYQEISKGQKVRGMEHWLPLFYNDDMDTVLDYMPNACIMTSDVAEYEISNEWSTISNYYSDRLLAAKQREKLEKKNRNNEAVVNRIKSQFLYNPIEPKLMYLSDEKVKKVLDKEFVVRFCVCGGEDDKVMDSRLRGNDNGVRHCEERSDAAIQKRNTEIQKISCHPELDSGSQAGFLVSNQEIPDQVRNDSNCRTINLSINPIPNFASLTQKENKNTFALLSEYLAENNPKPYGKKVIITAINTNSLERLESLLDAAEINCKEIKKFNDFDNEVEAGHIALVKLPLSHGFAVNDLILVTEQDLLGEKVVRRSSYSTKDVTTILKEVSGLKVGELVVHKEHGIGRFLGLETIEVQGIRNDFLKIEYGKGDNLFLPVEDIDVITRYGSDSELIGLDKLGGGTTWVKKRRKIRRNIMAIANELIKIAVQRKLRKAPVLAPGIGEYNEFCARFPFTETPDQLKSIRDIEEDLAKGTPMDRLVCGDVGFGKTEVAMRAAFMVARASKSKKQVAVIAPTTLLCRQHYKNFVERFKGTGLQIATLSRMVSLADAKLIKKKMEEGSIDIIVGTHALLAEDIKFKDLGLLIVDEEQRFGVKQKERLKEIKSSVHILTLSATPIPRTLQMSMSGIRELSIIATPPVDRLAVKTFVMPYDDIIIREALLREHYRGGQSFLVVPRIKDIPEVENRLRETVPEITFKVAHGQMPPKKLDDIMNQFYDNKFDVLLATTIIESGIDVPRANTMIVHKANMFGLAQLYQLRGRVGRSKAKAYAYLTVQSEKDITDTAEKRLEVMETLDSLGAGFTVASHDMDIRGSGNLLGEEQSGNVKEVGVELYNDMLKEAIRKLKESKEGKFELEQDDEDEFIPHVKVSVSTIIPADYIEDLTLRMSMYRRIAEIGSEEGAKELRGELTDRFGKIPEEVNNLIQIALVKHKCKNLNIEKLIGGVKNVTVQFYKGEFTSPDKLMELVFASRGKISVKEGQKLVFASDFAGGKKLSVLENMLRVLKELGRLV